MKRWFERQPIHRKLVLTSLLKASVVLLLAISALLVADFRRFDGAARADVESLAAMTAESVRAAVAFEDVTAIAVALDPLRLRPGLQRVCVYGRQQTLLGHHSRQRVDCPQQLQHLQRSRLSALAPVQQHGETVGQVYFERDWTVMRQRTTAAVLASLGVLVLATGATFLLSYRLHRHISEPIRRLASAARRIGDSDDFQMPNIPVSADEVGDLVMAFDAMAARIRAAQQDLTRTNDDLRREIAERARIESDRESLLRREQKANRAKDEFLATVSHELRTPLNAIVGWSQILATTKPGPDIVARAAESLYRNARVQARVIDDLIDISRIVSGKMRVDFAPVDLRVAVDSAVETLRGVADAAGTALEISLPTHPCHILGDMDRLKQVVWNLLSNAIKFAPRGRVRLALHCDGPTAFLTVTDNGVGIAAEFLPLVFDRFRQADSSVTRAHGGLGIGLAVVKELIELHSGTIAAESAGRGHGATFTVRLPIQPIPQRQHQTPSPVPSLAGVSILAIDDNTDTLEVIDLMLRAAGADVSTARSGAEGLEMWREAPRDVLLCDLAMPTMSGFDVIAAIRDIDRQAGRVTPAIAVTAHTSEEQVAEAIRAGFQGHIAKPFDKEHLVRMIVAARARV